MSTLSVATIKSASSAAPVFQNSSGTEKGQLAKAWINFDGSGVIGIRDSFNISSITDNATGEYTVTLDTAMSDANYSIVQGLKSPLANRNTFCCLGGSNENNPSTTAFQIVTCGSTNNSMTDANYIMAAVYGDN